VEIFANWKPTDWLTAGLALATFYLGLETRGVRKAAERDRLEADKRYREAAMPHVEVLGVVPQAYRVNVDPTREFILQLRNMGAVSALIEGTGHTGTNSHLVQIGAPQPQVVAALENAVIPLRVERHHPADVHLTLVLFSRSIATRQRSRAIRTFELTGPWDGADYKLETNPEDMISSPIDFAGEAARIAKERKLQPPAGRRWLRWFARK